MEVPLLLLILFGHLLFFLVNLAGSLLTCLIFKKQKTENKKKTLGFIVLFYVLKICILEKVTQMYRTDIWTLWEKARVGCFKRTASKHVYYLR